MHSTVEIENASSALANQLSAGISLREAIGRMAKLQPERAELWQECSESLSRGGRLSRHLEGEWPESVVAAVRAGEESGSLEEVFRRTQESMQVSQQVRKIYSKLISPVASFLVGFGVLVFFMVLVIPKLAKTLGGGQMESQGKLFKFSMVVSDLFFQVWPVALAAIVGGVVLGVRWLKSPENIDKLIAVGNSRPKLGAALRNLYFGMWAYQLALLDSAGLPAKQQLLLSVKTLPECYREGVLLMASELEKRGHADSADPDKQPEDDPRQEWPYYIATAFITAHETGRIDQEMRRCAPILIEEGLKGLTKLTVKADLVAKVAAAGMIALPLMAYFTQLANSLAAAFA